MSPQKERLVPIGVVILALITATIAGTDFAEEIKYSNKHDKFRPSKQLTANPKYNAQVALYYKLLLDYYDIHKRVYEYENIGWRAHRDFAEMGIKSEFATQIGVKNLAEYSEYIGRLADTIQQSVQPPLTIDFFKAKQNQYGAQ